MQKTEICDLLVKSEVDALYLKKIVIFLTTADKQKHRKRNILETHPPQCDSPDRQKHRMEERFFTSTGASDPSKTPIVTG